MDGEPGLGIVAPFSAPVGQGAESIRGASFDRGTLALTCAEEGTQVGPRNPQGGGRGDGSRICRLRFNGAVTELALPMPKLSAKQSRARPPARHGKNEYREVRCQKDQCILSAQALREASNALLVSEAGMEKSRSRWLSSELRSLSCRLGMAHGDQVRALKASAVNTQQASYQRQPAGSGARAYCAEGCNHQEFGGRVRGGAP